MFAKMLRSLQEITLRDKSSLETGEKKFVFVHIPKTAGMTMSAILEKKFPKDQICPIRLYPDLVVVPKADINKYRLFRGHFPYDILDCLLDEPFRCITVLREPVARYYSYYKFMKKREDFEQFTFLANEIPLIRKMDFKEFANANMVVVKDGLNQQCRYLGKETPVAITLPYVASKQNPTPDEIERAKTRLLNMEAFGLAERFQDSLFLMSYAFGWEPIMDKLVLNTSGGKSERLEITEDVKSFVEEKNKADVQLFQFAKTLFETRYQEMLSTLVAEYGKKVGVDASAELSHETIFKLLQQHAIATKKHGSALKN